MKEIYADISFLTREEGGRESQLPQDQFGAPVFFSGVPELSQHGYDCRIDLRQLSNSVSPGDEIRNVKIRFLTQKEVAPYLSPGVQFTLWEGKVIARGVITGVA